MIPAAERPTWRAVAIPSEHGGWGLTLEPVLLGLLVAASRAGCGIGAAAFLTFLARTPAKLVAVDIRRGRWLPRTRLAFIVSSVELALIAALVVAVTWSTGWRWWVPVLLAVPFVAVELWFDVRSRSRRLAPELCGAIGVAASSAAIVVAGDGAAALAAGVWLILAARSVGAIPFVRSQIVQAHRHVVDVRGSDLAQVTSVVVAGVAVAIDHRFAAGAVFVAVVAGVQARWSRREPPAIKVVGLRQMGIGLALVVVTAVGVRL